MMTVTARTAPAGARLAAGFGNPGKAHPAEIVLRCNAAGRSDLAAGFIRRSASLAAVDAALADPPNQADPPSPEQPNVAPDTGARLDAQDAQLKDHEARIARLEERMPAPAADGAPADTAPTEASAAATQQVSRMVNSAGIYGRLAALRTSRAPQAEAAMPDVIQTSAGRVLDGRAINSRHAQSAAARAGR